MSSNLTHAAGGIAQENEGGADEPVVPGPSAPPSFVRLPRSYRRAMSEMPTLRYWYEPDSPPIYFPAFAG